MILLCESITSGLAVVLWSNWSSQVYSQIFTLLGCMIALQIPVVRALMRHIRLLRQDSTVRSQDATSSDHFDEDLASILLARHRCLAHRIDRLQESGIRAFEGECRVSLPQVWVDHRAVPLLVGQPKSMESDTIHAIFRPFRGWVAVAMIVIFILWLPVALITIAATTGFSSAHSYHGWHFVGVFGMAVTVFVLMTSMKKLLKPSGQLVLSHSVGRLERPMRSPRSIDLATCRVVVSCVRLPGYRKDELAPVWWVFPIDGGCIRFRCDRPDQTPWGEAVWNAIDAQSPSYEEIVTG